MATRKSYGAAEYRQFAEAYRGGATIAEIARQMDTPRGTVTSWRDALEKETLEVTPEFVKWSGSILTEGEDDETEDKLEISEEDDKSSITSVSRNRRTLEEVLKAAEIDSRIWKVVKVDQKRWEVPMKLHPGETIETGEDGKSRKVRGADKPKKVPVYYIALKLERTVPKHTYEGIRLCCNEFLKKYRPKTAIYKPRKVADPHMLEVSIFDAHLSKLAWAQEAGQNYDLKIAKDIYLKAGIDLVNKVAGYNIERILFPVGQDFIQIDNRQGTTTKGTSVDFDSRYHKIVKTAQATCIQLIDFFRTVAPVDIVFVRGNHDETVSWHIVDFLSGWYHDVKDVTVDISPRDRKYIQYGPTVLGLAHGDKGKLTRLPLIMMTETRKMFDLSKVNHFEFHTGHLHTRKKIDFVSVDSECEVTVRVIPSISATDYWHSSMGFVGNQRAAEAYLWSKDHGYTGHFNSTVGQELPCSVELREPELAHL